jgi:hypothetical protein
LALEKPLKPLLSMQVSGEAACEVESALDSPLEHFEGLTDHVDCEAYYLD